MLLLLRIYTVIAFCKFLICIDNRRILYCSLLTNCLCQMWLCKFQVSSIRDTQLKFVPKSNSCESFSICNWILNSISTHNFSKMSLLGTFKNYVRSIFPSFDPPPPALFVLVCFRGPPPPPPRKVRSFWLELTRSHSISILVKFRDKKLMSTSIFG